MSREKGIDKAVDDDDLNTTSSIFFHDKDELEEYSSNYWSSLQRSRLVKLIKDVKYDDIKNWIKKTSMVNLEQSLLNNVLDAVNPSNDISRWIADGTELACIPEISTSSSQIFIKWRSRKRVLRRTRLCW